MKSSIISVLVCLSLSVPLSACDGPESADADAPHDELLESAERTDEPALAVAKPAAPGQAAKPKALAHHAGPGPVMPGARQAYDELLALVDAEYVDGPLSEDEIWTGAMEGVLARLVQLHGHQINTLMSPRELEQLMVGTKGSLVGVGIMIERVADVVVVRKVIPDGPAEAAGLRAGDRILGIDGERTKAMELIAVVDRIRGAEGSSVELFVQRDTEEWTETIVRGRIKVPSVQSASLPDGQGYVRITSFSSTTAEELDAQLAALDEQGAQSLVLDLRHCPGGLLEASLDVIERFVPPGKTMMTIDKRDAESDVRVSEGEYPWQSRPMVVLIGSKTASGAEILADAVAEHGRGRLVGETTMGKHTVESIHELSGGWAIKLSVSRFASASGQRTQGVGVEPHVRITAPADYELASVDALVPEEDPVLSAALAMMPTE